MRIMRRRLWYPPPLFVSGAPWTPASLGGALIAWYKADAGVYKDAGVTLCANGDTVEQWNDQSGNGFHLSQVPLSGDRPTFNTASFNSNKGITFAASTSEALTNAAFTALNSTTASAFILFSSQTGGAGNGRVFSFVAVGNAHDYDNAASFELQQAGGTTQTAGALANGGYLGNGGALFSYAFNTPQSLGLIFDGSNAHTYEAFTEQTPAMAYTSTLGGSGSSNLSIGYYDGVSFATPAGVIAEIVFTNTALSSADRTNLKNYFSGKWGVF